MQQIRACRPTQISHDAGVSVSSLPYDGIEEIFILSQAMVGESPEACHIRALKAAQCTGAHIVKQEIFAAKELNARIKDETARRFGAITWPLSHLLDDSGDAPFTGSCIRLIKGTSVKSIAVGKRIIGSLYEGRTARYLYLGDLHGTDAETTQPEQTQEVFEQIVAGLDAAGMSFSNVVRTWFYNDDILAWYDDFNVVRTAFFNDHNVFSGLVPASTGIGAANVDGAALNVSLIAVDPKCSSIDVARVDSPLQCPAWDYKSSFSRAAEVVGPDFHRLFVSGTASIEPGGNSIHQGDMEKQIELTMRVVQAILESREMDWSDVCHSIVYIRNVEDKDAFREYCKRHDLQLPYVLTNTVVCRDDLLFEIEVDVFKSLA